VALISWHDPTHLYHLGSLTERSALNERIIGDLHRAGVSQNLIDSLRSDKSFTSTNYEGVTDELNKARRLIQQKTNQKTAQANIKVHTQVSLQGYAQNILKAVMTQADMENTNSAPKGGRNWWTAIPGVASDAITTMNPGAAVPLELVDHLIGGIG
jgi:hypothetical protein